MAGLVAPDSPCGSSPLRQADDRVPQGPSNAWTRPILARRRSVAWGRRLDRPVLQLAQPRVLPARGLQGDCDLYVMINAYHEPLRFTIQESRSGGWKRAI